jgi:DNA helicase-2/ATP-dependent DNA helicase PcrA
VAGAGTGKTTVITRRVAWLIDQGLARPEEILALTFTDKAATEMAERIDRALPLGYVDVQVSTFHAFGEAVLKDWGLEIGLPNDFKLLSTTEQWMMVKEHLSKFNLDYYRPLGNPTKFIHALLQHFSRAKDEEVYPEDYLKFAESRKLDTGATEFISRGKRKKPASKKAAKVEKVDVPEESEAVRLDEVAKAYSAYQKLLLESGALDFGDLINYTVKLFRTRPKVLQHFQAKYKYILVDEFQDTNYAQYELIKLLSLPRNNITVVGDDDQSIYKFRGASISNILEFKRDYPKAQEVFLTTSYRSYQNILDTAYEFIQLNNPYRLEVKLAGKGKSLSKKLLAFRTGQGQVQALNFPTAQAEAEAVVDKIVELQKKTGAAWSDFAILVRANSSASIFLQALKARQLPFDYVANRGLYAEPIILDVTAYLKLLDNYHESEALYRVLTMEPFRVPQVDVSSLVSQAHRRTISLYEALRTPGGPQLSAEGTAAVQRLLTLIDQHTAFAREHAGSEVYVRVVEDLGINDRVAHPALVREAACLTEFYQRLQRFELDTDDRTLTAFLRYLTLELEAGEEGQLPKDTDEGPETVKVITVHSAKGLEWKYVFIVQLVDRRFPSTERREPIELPKELIKEVLPEGDVHLQEERRLFYVGLTRARDGVFLTRAEDYFGKTTRKPSRFLYELGFVTEAEASAPATRIKPTAPAVVTPRVASYPVPESFSFSSVSAYRKCPLEYKYRYLLRLPTPGHHSLSFGITMHRTLEQFMKLWQQRSGAVQEELFSGAKSGKVELPTERELMALFEQSWVDDWYPDKQTKQEYRASRGPKQLKNFYQQFVATKPTPKFLEKMFKFAMGPYKFTGKIDRLDETSGGLTILDYKTGGTAATEVNKVDRDQLIIYQIAAQEFLREKVVGAQYWYLEPNQFSESFVASDKQITALKTEYTAAIAEIIETVQSDSFLKADEAIRHQCEYRHLS